MSQGRGLNRELWGRVSGNSAVPGPEMWTHDFFATSLGSGVSSDQESSLTRAVLVACPCSAFGVVRSSSHDKSPGVVGCQGTPHSLLPLSHYK
jgi:hypothetical protein